MPNGLQGKRQAKDSSYLSITLAESKKNKLDKIF